MNLGEQRPPALPEPLDHPDLPQRLVAIQVLGEDPGRGPAQLVVVARGRERGVPQVVGEVEVRVLHPYRATQPERHEADLLPIAGYERKLARDHVLESLKRGRGTFEDADTADVHRVRRSLDVQERRVHRAHPLHARPSRSGIPALAGVLRSRASPNTR